MRAPRRLAAAAFLLAGIVFVGGARASEPDGALAEARRAVIEGQHDVAQANYEQAASHFQEALETLAHIDDHTHDREVVNSLKKRVITLENGNVISDQKTGHYLI